MNRQLQVLRTQIITAIIKPCHLPTTFIFCRILLYVEKVLVCTLLVSATSIIFIGSSMSGLNRNLGNKSLFWLHSTRRPLQSRSTSFLIERFGVCKINIAHAIRLPGSGIRHFSGRRMVFYSFGSAFCWPRRRRRIFVFWG